jgi:hypothetical protein
MASESLWFGLMRWRASTTRFQKTGEGQLSAVELKIEQPTERTCERLKMARTTTDDAVAVLSDARTAGRPR